VSFLRSIFRRCGGGDATCYPASPPEQEKYRSAKRSNSVRYSYLWAIYGTAVRVPTLTSYVQVRGLMRRFAKSQCLNRPDLWFLGCHYGSGHPLERVF
jgi:hypothetical protein